MQEESRAALGKWKSWVKRGGTADRGCWRASMATRIHGPRDALLTGNFLGLQELE
jgi:hypothetical protein